MGLNRPTQPQTFGRKMIDPLVVKDSPLFEGVANFLTKGGKRTPLLKTLRAGDMKRDCFAHLAWPKRLKMRIQLFIQVAVSVSLLLGGARRS